MPTLARVARSASGTTRELGRLTIRRVARRGNPAEYRRAIVRRFKLSRLGRLKNGRAASGRALASVTLATLLALAGAGTAWAHQDPPACSGTGVAITFEVLRNDGSPIDLSETVTECELLTYRAMLAKSTAGNPCAFEGGTITITTPDGVAHDVTPSGGVPCVGGTVAGGCGATSSTSNTATYSVRPQDVASGEVTAQVDYMAAFSHTRATPPPTPARTTTSRPPPPIPPRPRAASPLPTTAPPTSAWPARPIAARPRAASTRPTTGPATMASRARPTPAMP